MLSRSTLVFIGLIVVAITFAPSAHAQEKEGATAREREPLMLIGTIVKWRYPDAKIGAAEMSDAATMNADGQRTVSSTLLKTTMTTEDSVAQVLEFYRELLERDPAKKDHTGITQEEGRSILFSDESDGRPFSFHTILVNDKYTSTTMVITRGGEEDLTYITWKQYVRGNVVQ